jgi:microcystin-dependent protein
MEIITVRIPELPLDTSGLKNLDRVPVWKEQSNTTEGIELQTLRAFVMEGLTASTPPVYVGGSFAVEVGADQAGGQIFLIPSMAGKSFNLRRQGMGIVPIDQWEVLDAGGFKLTTPGDVLVFGEIFELDVIDFQNGGNITAGGGLGFGIAKPIPTNYTILTTEIGGVFQVRGGSSIVTITLPDIASIPLYSLLPFEASINNQFQAGIQAQGGQKIYFNNKEYTKIRLGVGESVWLYNTASGWFVIDAYGQWNDVGRIVQAHAPGLNEILCNGLTLQRAEYPRLWEYAQTLGPSLVTESVWSTVSAVASNGDTILRPYAGCFSSGDGVLTFRIPDLTNCFIRGLKSGSDTSRIANVAGARQKDQMPAHRHFLVSVNSNILTNVALTISNFIAKIMGNGAGQSNSNYEYALNGSSAEPTVGLSSSAGSGSGTVVENIGLNYYIKY